MNLLGTELKAGVDCWVILHQSYLCGSWPVADDHSRGRWKAGRFVFTAKV